MTLDYFYANQAEQFAFYRIPKVLFTEERFHSLSAEAKVLYGILLDRMSLSQKNGWLDDEGRVYIIFTLEEIQTAMGCADQKATKLLAELEQKSGLLARKRQGLGRPNLIYVKNFVTAPESRIQNRENHDSGIANITIQEPLKSRSSNTDYSNTDLSDTDSFLFPSVTEGREPTRREARQMYRGVISENIEFGKLLAEYPWEQDVLTELLDLIVDVVCTTRDSIRVSRDDKPADVVKAQFLKLNAEHIRYVMDALKKNTTQIHDTRQYLLATLFNATMTISSHFRSCVNHDGASGYAPTERSASPLARLT